MLAGLITWKGTLCENSLLVNCVEQIKRFFEQLKRSLYSATGANLLSKSRSATQNNVDSVRDSKEYQFTTHMVLFLE